MTHVAERLRGLSQIVNDPKKHLLYYRHCLADGERMDIPAKIVREKGCMVPVIPTLPESSVRKLFVDLPKEQTSLNILYSPFALHPVMKDGVRPADEKIYPFWIPAVIERSGILNPPQNDTDIPWLIRGVLAPNDYLSREYPVLSSVERVDKVGTTFQIPRDNWDVYLAGALDYYADQVRVKDRNLRDDGWEVSTDQIALVPADLSGLTAPLIQFYDHFLEPSEKRLPGTLQSLLSPKTTEPETIEDPSTTVLNTSHYGQMADRFPLSPSQRISLALLDKTAAGQVFAVNGPPGTGKTTLIQSVVADLVVKSFLANRKPPLIVGSSANNKAITNILDSFASVAPEESFRTGLNERWLPELDVMGHYLAANSSEKLQKANDAGYWVSTSRSKGTDAYLSYCEAHPKTACEEYFLTKFRTLQETPDTSVIRSCDKFIKDTVSQLRTTIDRVSQRIRKVLEFISEFELDDAKIVTLADTVESRIKNVREERTHLEELIQREHLRPDRPRLLSRWLERLRFGDPGIRRARIQSVLIQRSYRSINKEQQDLYALATEIWAYRDHCFRDESKLSEGWNSVKPRYEKLHHYLETLDPAMTCGSREWIEAVQGMLDVGERHDAFWWAMHGLECRWLMQRDDDAYGWLNQGEPESLRRWEQRSFLTPVFVSTFHSLPNFFSFKKKTPQGVWLNPPLTDSLDLLVIDEAGQVAPELGIPAFGLAKKAVVVGDVRQLEPIWSIPSEPIDFSNARRGGIVGEHSEYEGFAQSHRSSVNGSLMVLAQDASAFMYPPLWNEAGSLLVEHRRCAPEIIEYCNRFVYRSLLDIKTKSRRSDWPALGYCHIGGESREDRSSRSNPVEARAIAAWIQKNKESLIPNQKAGLADVLAIVTPFRRQQEAIVKALKAAGVYEKAMVVGTVHSLQGAEKPIVIFSPVYGRNHQSRSLFFNQSYNMLNVAISRAKDHFFVFGNMALFSEKEAGTPAGDLARLLFQTLDNEIRNDFLFTEPHIEFFDQKPIKRLSELQQHRAALTRAFKTAEKRLVIVSPFISQVALQADGIPDLVASTVKRNVEVIVVTDANLDRDKRSLRPQAKAGRQALEKSGATLKVMAGVHNKTIIIDRRILVEGSFNWLSAVRDDSSPYHRREASIVVMDSACEQLIVRAEQELGLQAGA